MSKILEAGSGFYLLEIFDEGVTYTKPVVTQTPIVGWFVEYPDKMDKAMAYPMTPSGVHKSTNRFILSPNGEVSNGLDISWSYDDWFDDQSYELELLRREKAGNGSKDTTTDSRTPSLPTTQEISKPI